MKTKTIKALRMIARWVLLIADARLPLIEMYGLGPEHLERVFTRS
jgi:hypothetical protein